MKPSAEQIETVLDLVYDAAAENDLWRQALTAIADITNSQGGILFGFSFTAQKVICDYNGRLDEDCNRAFQERHLDNPWGRYMSKQPVGRLVMSDEVISVNDLRNTEFYDDVLRPQGIAHNGMMALAAWRDFQAAFNLCRNARQGTFAPDELRLIERLTPHLRRSIELGFRIDGYVAMQQAAFNVLEQIMDGIIVLNRSAHVLYANAAARKFEIEGALRLRPPIATTSLAHTQQLTELINVALRGAAGGTMSVPRDSDGHLLTILVSSIRSKDLGRLSDAGLKDPAVLVFLVDPANRRSIPLWQIMDAYGLTQAEARVALATSSGNTVGEAAQLLKLSANTIKTHLRRVFAKTATARQAELAGLIAAVGSLRIPGSGAD
jgi:DNA-binding CsgD family transcriptional regulator